MRMSISMRMRWAVKSPDRELGTFVAWGENEKLEPDLLLVRYFCLSAINYVSGGTGEIASCFPCPSRRLVLSNFRASKASSISTKLRN